MIRSTRRHSAALALGALMLVPGIAACSSDNKTAATTTTTATLSTAGQWASDACTSIDTWRTTVIGVAATFALPRNMTSGTVAGGEPTNRVDELKAANTKLIDDLKAAGPPETDDGQQIRTAVDTLSTQLDTSMAQVTSSIDAFGQASSVVDRTTAAAGATTAINQLATDVSSASTTIRQLDPAGEMGKAIADTPACQNLRDGKSEGPVSNNDGS